jgi:Ca-activated chloride channel family protein
MSKLEFGGLGLNLFDVVNATIPALVIFLAGALLVAAMLYFHLKRRRFKLATVKYSDIRIVKGAERTNRQRYRFLVTALRVAAVVLLIVAFARPRSGTEYQEISSEGVDILLALDVSSSMQA